MIIAGERRWRAANLAGLTEVPCIELDIDEKSIAEIALIENLQRKDLTVWEEADGFAYLVERFGYTHEEIAKKIGKSRTTVTESMAIAGLPESIRVKCRQSKINAKSTLLEVARQFDEKAMHDLLDNIGTKGYKRQKNSSEPQSKVKLTQGNQTERIIKDDNGKTFKYTSPDNDFTLEISFNNVKVFDNRDVLQALKEVYAKTNKST
jgi:ParB family chromosome partitioning protein